MMPEFTSNWKTGREGASPERAIRPIHSARHSSGHLKAAMTLDGKIAPPPAEATSWRTPARPPGGWITSDVARAHVQELRHQNDALMVGAGTIIADNPLLTDRSGQTRRRPLLRVILDSRLRFPPNRDSWQARAGNKNDVLVFCASPG